MPDNMRYDNNGQPMGYGDPMDPSMYPQADQAWGQYPQGGYATPMPSPQDIYSQQQYMDPSQAYMDPNQAYADPTQAYADPNQAYMDQQQMYGQPMQQDPYSQYPQQAAYPEPDPAMGGQMPYVDPNQAYMDPQMQGYGQAPQAYPGAQPMQQGYGQVPQQPAQQQMPQGQFPQQAPAAPEPAQQLPQQDMSMDKKAAKRAAKEQKRAAKAAPAQSAPANMGPAPSDGKATLCLILGILSVVFALFPPVGIVLGIVGRKMATSYMKAGGRAPKADTGRIFATVGFIFSIIMLVVLIIMGIIIWAGLYGESVARNWAVFFNNSPFGNIVRIPIPNPFGN